MAVSTAPRIAYGATVSYNAVTINNVTNIKPPEAEVPKVKATVLASVNPAGSPHETAIPGAVNYSACEVTAQYDAVTYEGLLASAAARTTATLLITAQATGETWSATAWISKGPTADFKAANEVVEMKVSFELTAGFTYTESTSSATA